MMFDDFFEGYIVTNHGSVENKLEYTFGFYNMGVDDTLDKAEIIAGIDCMLKLLGAKRSENDSLILANECFRLVGLNENASKMNKSMKSNKNYFL